MESFPNLFPAQCTCGGYLSQRTSSQEVKCDNCEDVWRVEDYTEEEAGLAREVSQAADSDIATLFEKLSGHQHLHPTHYVLVMLYMR